MIPAGYLVGGAVAAATIAVGAVHPRSQIFGDTIRCTNSPRKLAITFDDGPNPLITPSLLALLEKYRVRATFFMIGGFAAGCPNLVRDVAAAGHEIGNHTQTHPNLFWCSPQGIRDQIADCHASLSGVLGYRPKYFRPPYGFRNPWVVSAASALGMQTVMWTLIPGDWREKTAEWLIRRIAPIEKRARYNFSTLGYTGDVLCLHDGGHRALNADRTHTLAALAYWLPRWRDLGLEFVTISEAVGAPAH
jgi:peptidoglycan/xylan/chitin deacetylase (PgdA/CDA1 family)